MKMELRTFGQAIAHIDLGSGETEIRPAPADWVKKYIGTRGWENGVVPETKLRAFGIL